MYLGWENVYCIQMGHDRCVIGDENLGFIITTNFVTNTISCTVVLVVIIMYLIVISMIIFTIVNSFEMFHCAKWKNNI
jgi:hypothetical protein